MGASTHSWPPGFRFRPTDRELVAHYLTRKVLGRNIEEGIIAEIDLYKCEPWDLPDKSYFGSRDDEWYFFSARDRKYPNGSRTNRATEAGYWKATGKDRTIRTGSKTAVGMKKTLVFYMGRAPHGKRTDWIMHEYRLEDGEGRQFVAPQDTFVLCRVFKKGAPKNEDEGPLVEDESAQGQESSAGLTQDSPKLTVGIVARVSTASGKVETTPLLMPKEELPCCVQNSHSSPTIEDKEESSGDSLDAFLSMLLDDVPKPSQEQHIPMADAPVQENENWSGETSAEFMDAVLSAFGNEDDAVAQQGKLNFEDDLNIIDLLEGNFFELNDLQNLDGNARNGENYTDFPTEPERYQYQNSGMQLFSSDIYGGESTHNQTDQTQNKMYTAPQLPHGGRRDKNLISMIDAKFPSGEDITDSSVISTPGSCTLDDYSSMVSTDARIVPPADAWEVDFSDPLLYFNDMEASATSLYAEGPSVLNDRNEETYFEPLGEALPSEEPKPSMVDTSQASVSTSVSTVQSSHQTNSRQKPLGKFLSLLGSVQVLPASAAEFPADFSKSNSLVKGVTVSSSGSKGQTIQVASMNVCVAAVTVTCTEKPKELSGQITDCPKEQKMLCTTCGMKERSRSEKVKQNGARVKQTGVRVMNGVSYFIFLLGSVSALFWILFFHGISKLSSYICGVLS